MTKESNNGPGSMLPLPIDRGLVGCLDQPGSATADQLLEGGKPRPQGTAWRP
jgi:hypothetical protein